MGSVVGTRRWAPALAPIRGGRLSGERAARAERLGGGARENASSALTYTTCFR